MTLYKDMGLAFKDVDQRFRPASADEIVEALLDDPKRRALMFQMARERAMDVAGPWEEIPSEVEGSTSKRYMRAAAGRAIAWVYPLTSRRWGWQIDDLDNGMAVSTEGAQACADQVLHRRGWTLG